MKLWPRPPDWPAPWLHPAGRAQTALIVVWLLAGPWLLFPTVAPLLSALALCLLTGGWLLSRRWQPPHHLATPLDVAVVVYAGFYALGYLSSPLPALSLPKLVAAIWGLFAYLLCRQWLDRPERQERLFAGLALAGAGVTLVGLVSLGRPATFLVDIGPLLDRLPHLTGSFYLNRNELAGTLLLTLPFAWAWLRRLTAARWPAWVAFALILFGLFLTQSRGALLAAAAAVAAGWLWPRPAPRRLLIAGLVLATPLLWAMAMAAPSESVIAEQATALDDLSKGGWADDTSFVTRLEMWRNAGAMAGDYPVTGAGLYVFEPVSWGWYGYRFVSPRLGLIHAHNLWLQTAATLGVSGLLALGLVWGLALYQLQWAPPRTAAVIGAALVAYHTFSLFDVLSLGHKPGIFIWLLLAGIAAAGRPPHGRGRWARLLPVVPVLLLLLLSLTPVGARNRANSRLDAARWGAADRQVAFALSNDDARRQGVAALLAGDETLALARWRTDAGAALFLRNQAQVADQAGTYDTAFAWYGRALAIAPTDYTIYHWRGLTWERVGDTRLALSDAAQAAVLMPPWTPAPAQIPVDFQWGRMLAANDQWPAALPVFQRLIELAPSNPLYHLWLARAYLQLGDEAAAERAFAAAVANGHDSSVLP